MAVPLRKLRSRRAGRGAPGFFGRLREDGGNDVPRSRDEIFSSGLARGVYDAISRARGEITRAGASIGQRKPGRNFYRIAACDALGFYRGNIL